MLKIQLVDYPPPTEPLTAVPPATDFIIHHTAGALTQTPLEIDAEHRAIGDTMIAYELLITPDGTVYYGRPIGFESAATFGRNPCSINVALIGQFQPNAGPDVPPFAPPTDAQLDALLQVSIWVHRHYPLIVRTIGHRDVAPMFYPQDEKDYSTACPGDALYAQIPDIKRKTAAALNSH